MAGLGDAAQWSMLGKIGDERRPLDPWDRGFWRNLGPEDQRTTATRKKAETPCEFPCESASLPGQPLLLGGGRERRA